MVTNKELNQCREAGCTAIFAEKKYFRVGNVFIKRTLRPHEWQSTNNGALVVPPASLPQRWRNDAAALRYLSQKITTLPLPRLQCIYEDDGAFNHCTEYVEGVSMEELSDMDKKVVTKELLQHLSTLKSLRSDTPGMPGESLLYPPQRVTRQGWKMDSCWRPRSEIHGDFVFCHNDLVPDNIIVDPKTLKIKAILDWEFGGFWPEWFEREFWEREVPGSALDREEDDVERCRQWLQDNCDEVPVDRLQGVLEQVTKLAKKAV